MRRVIAILAAACGALAFAATPAAGQTGGAQPPPDPNTAPPAESSSPYPQVFPVPGPHTYGEGWGAGRRHRGQDVFAACGEPLVSVSWARVIFVGKHRRAGNYIVLRFKKLKQDYAYMHLAGRPLVRVKQKVAPGQLVGYVGASGNARGCHLHFELWVGRWYRGGRAVNPLPALQYWDSYS